MYSQPRRRKRTPEEEERLRIIREEIIETVKVQLTTDPRYCWDMPHPDTDFFRNKVLNHAVLQAHFRPDLFDKRYRHQRPPIEVVEEVVTDVFLTANFSFLRRTLREAGIYWCNKSPLQMGLEVCTLFFSKLRKEDLEKLQIQPFPAGLGCKPSRFAKVD